jgi:hypothetical protein
MCDEWIQYAEEIFGVQLFAVTHGIVYKGEPFRFCPWCGKALEKRGE